MQAGSLSMDIRSIKGASRESQPKGGGYLSNFYDVTALTTFVGYQAAVVLDPRRGSRGSGPPSDPSPRGGERRLPGNAADNDYVVIYIHVYICYSRVMLPYSSNEQRINTCSPPVALGGNYTTIMTLVLCVSR